MLRLLFFSLIVLSASETYGQGANYDFLNEEAGSASGVIGDFLKEDGGAAFDPRDELDRIKSSRIEKQLEETKQAKKVYDSRMARECDCLLGECPYVSVVRTNDTRTQAEKRADAERNKRARAQRKSLCLRWFCSGGANSAEEIQSARARGVPVSYPGIWNRTTEDRCPGGKIQQEGDGEEFHRRLRSLEARLDHERAVEERLRQQRRADEKRKRQAQIEEQTAKRAAEQKRLRQRAEAQRREREAAKLAACRETWSQRRNLCGCGGLPEAPAWVRGAPTCEK